MAKMIDINKSTYINNNIEIFAQNKIGQYSKFLNKNPIYVTYYHINNQLSRADAGTGSVQDDLGTNSPIRFNEIIEFPIYNLPEIKPDIVFDDSGYDIELDLSDITILPGTIKPMVNDYIIFKIPGVEKELLFRINNVKYNTIQSNDFYIVDLDIREIGINLRDRLSTQIVEVYQTIFDNIGTDDKCFILLDNLEKIKAIVKTYNHFKDLYSNIFYNKECNSFVFYDNQVSLDQTEPIWLYDYYISKFITETQLYYVPNEEKSLVLTYNDTLPIDMNNQYNKTLLAAVYNRSIDYLNTYTYYFQSAVRKEFSPFVLNGYNCNSTNLHFSKVEIDTTCPNGGIYLLQEYYSSSLIQQIKNNFLTSSDFIDVIIFNYLTNKNIDITKDDLINYNFDNNLRTYMYLPLVLYILRQYYDEYFRKS